MNGCFNIMANAGQNRFNYDGPESTSLWSLKPDDIFKLDTWSMERTMIIIQLETITRLPSVLCDIVIKYSGSGYADILITLGRSSDFVNLVNSCKSRDRRRGIQSARSIIKILANAIRMPEPLNYGCSHIRDTISNMSKYNSYPDHVAELKRCAVFHQLLLIYF